jgi:hypothetical protein
VNVSLRLCHACGDWIKAVDTPESIERAVRLHRAAYSHQRWLEGVAENHPCAGVGGSPCSVAIPLDRDLCHWCQRTLVLMGAVA